MVKCTFAVRLMLLSCSSLIPLRSLLISKTGQFAFLFCSLTFLTILILIFAIVLVLFSFRGDYTPLRCIESASRLAVGFPINGVGSNNQIITSIEDIYKKKEVFKCIVLLYLT